LISKKLGKITLLFAAAFAMVLSFSRYNCNIFAWFALSPLILVTTKVKKPFWWGILFGVFFYCGNLYWLNKTLMFFGGLPVFLSIPALLILVFYLSLYYGAFCHILKMLHKRYPIWGLWYAPFVWVGLEWVRSFLLTGFPWSILGYSQHNFIPVIQIAQYTGVYGVSFLLVLANVLFARWIILNCRRRLALESFVFLLLFLTVIAWGDRKINSLHELQKTVKNTVRAAVVQGNIEQTMKWDPEKEKEILDIYDNLTKNSGHKNPDIFIWPETAVPFLVQADPKKSDRLKELSHTVKAPIVTGAVTFNISKDRQVSYSNSSIIVTPNSKLAKVYDKMHLVPFGEYVPLKDVLFFVEKLVTAVGELTPGKAPHVYRLPSFTFGVVICYEIIFPDLVRKFAKNGAHMIMNLTNDAWYGDTDAPFQHWAMVAFRSVENRVWVARAANTGISGFINPCGEVVKKTRIFSRTVCTLDVNILEDYNQTFYTQHGDIFAKHCFAFACVLLLICGISGYRKNLSKKLI